VPQLAIRALRCGDEDLRLKAQLEQGLTLLQSSLGAPHVTPIASVMLTEPGRGVLFDIFTSRLARNLEHDPRLCVMAVDTTKRIWVTSMLIGRFALPPATRLTGTAGPRRAATPKEQQRWLRRVRPLSRLKGHALLWGNLTHVRDLAFEEVIPVGLGAMTRDPGT